MPRKTHHNVPNPEGGWDVKKGGGEKAIKHFEVKKDAVDYGRDVSINQKNRIYYPQKRWIDPESR